MKIRSAAFVMVFIQMIQGFDPSVYQEHYFVCHFDTKNQETLEQSYDKLLETAAETIAQKKFDILNKIQKTAEKNTKFSPTGSFDPKENNGSALVDKHIQGIVKTLLGQLSIHPHSLEQKSGAAQEEKPHCESSTTAIDSFIPSQNENKNLNLINGELRYSAFENQYQELLKSSRQDEKNKTTFDSLDEYMNSKLQKMKNPAKDCQDFNLNASKISTNIFCSILNLLEKDLKNLIRIEISEQNNEKTMIQSTNLLNFLKIYVIARLLCKFEGSICYNVQNSSQNIIHEIGSSSTDIVQGISKDLHNRLLELSNKDQSPTMSSTDGGKYDDEALKDDKNGGIPKRRFTVIYYQHDTPRLESNGSVESLFNILDSNWRIFHEKTDLGAQYIGYLNTFQNMQIRTNLGCIIPAIDFSNCLLYNTEDKSVRHSFELEIFTLLNLLKNHMITYQIYMYKMIPYEKWFLDNQTSYNIINLLTTWIRRVIDDMAYPETPNNSNKIHQDSSGRLATEFGDSNEILSVVINKLQDKQSEIQDNSYKYFSETIQGALKKSSSEADKIILHKKFIEIKKEVLKLYYSNIETRQIELTKSFDIYKENLGLLKSENINEMSFETPKNYKEFLENFIKNYSSLSIPYSNHSSNYTRKAINSHKKTTLEKKSRVTEFQATIRNPQAIKDSSKIQKLYDQKSNHSNDSTTSELKNTHENDQTKGLGKKKNASNPQPTSDLDFIYQHLLAQYQGRPTIY